MLSNCLISEFKITSWSKKLIVEEGKNLELWCSSNIPWDSCEITHVPSAKSCKHYANSTATPITTTVSTTYPTTQGSALRFYKNGRRMRLFDSCSNLEGRFEYTGDTGRPARKCGFKIKNVQEDSIWFNPEEESTWRCDLRRSELKISKSLKVFMLPKANPTFPFKWNKDKYSTCLKVNERSLCPPEAMKNKQIRRWRVCGSSDNSIATNTTICTGDDFIPCVFPFKWGNISYSGCITGIFGNDQWGCPRITNKDGSNPHYWQKCRDDCPTACPTLWGDKSCLFPFIHEGEKVHGCLPATWQDALHGSRPYCPTDIDTKGFPLNYLYCSNTCKVVTVSTGLWEGFYWTEVSILLLHMALILNKCIRIGRKQKAPSEFSCPTPIEMNIIHKEFQPGRECISLPEIPSSNNKCLSKIVQQGNEERVNNLLLRLKWSKTSGWKMSRKIYRVITDINGGDIEKTNKFIFNYLGTGGGPEYLFSHVDDDLGSCWEGLSKKWFSLIYLLAEVQILSVSMDLVIMFSKSSIYILDIVKDVRFLMLILIPLTGSLPFVILSIMALILSETAKIVQLYSMESSGSRAMRLGYAVLSPIMPVLLHHKEFMLKHKLKRVASLSRHDRENEIEFTKVRNELHDVLVTRAELRATENLLEHLPQVIIPFAVLTTLEQAEAQLAQTEGKKLFLYLSLSISVLSIVLGQINLISARKNGQLGIIASLLVLIYILIAIASRGLILLAVLHVVVTVEDHSKYVTLLIFAVILCLHLSISALIQTKVFRVKKKRLRQSLWTILAPPLFLDWDELYRREEGKISVDECWDRTEVVFMLHNFLTCFGNVVLLITCLLSGKTSPLYPSLIEFFNLSSLTSPMLEIFLVIYCIASACAFQAIQIWITFLYYKKFHPWARVLFPPDMSSISESTAHVEKELKSTSPLRRHGSEADFEMERFKGATLMPSKSAPNLTAINVDKTIDLSEEVVAADNESSSLLHSLQWMQEIPRLRRLAGHDWLGFQRA